MKLKPGDIVVVKSGGPYMTVSYVSEDGVGCMWFNEYDHTAGLQTDSFPLATLKKIKRKELLVE